MRKIFALTLLASTLLFINISFAKETFQDEQPYYNQFIRSFSTGKGVVVAVIDTGIWQAHPDLFWSEWTNKKEIQNNNIDDDGNGYIDDYFGWNFVDNNADMTPQFWHGTEVAGIISAQINEKGIAGIAPDAKIMSLIACDSRGGCPTNSVINAIKYAVDNWAGVINLSLGGEGYVGYSAEYDSIISYAYSKGVVVVASAGNGDPEAPWAKWQDLDFLRVSPIGNDLDGINMVLGVGAFDAPWSNYGSYVDVTAQGTKVITTADPLYAEGYGYTTVNGTSFSAPYVSWAVALLKSANPSLKVYEIIDIISSVSEKKLIALPKMMTSVNDGSNGCSISSEQTISATNWDVIIIKFSHLRSKVSFSLISSEGTQEIKQNINSAVNILDARTLSINTKTLNLKDGTYSLISNNDLQGGDAFCKCQVGINITGGKKTPNPSPTFTHTNTISNVLSDWDTLAGKWIINKQNTEEGYNLKSNVLRQEVIGMAMKLGKFNLPNDYICQGVFSDVSGTKPNNWACRAIEVGVSNGIVSNLNKTFRPESFITRAEALAILMKAAGVGVEDSNGVTQFNDVKESWQINVVNTALKNDFINLTANFYPNKNATRGEIFNMAKRILEAQS